MTGSNIQSEMEVIILKKVEGLAVKIPPFLEKIVNLWQQKENKKPLSAKEKWMLLLLSGVLLAVIIFPAGKKDSEESGLLSGMGNSGNTESGGGKSDGVGLDWLQNGSGDNSEESNFAEYGISGEMLTLKQYETYLSKELEAILSQIDGAGTVEAWVTLASSSEKVLYQEKDSDTTDLQEADSVGGTRSEQTANTQQTVVLDSNGNPYIVKTLQPQVEGVLVVAEGAGDSIIKKNISEAVQVLFGIDAHRIKVAKKKVEE